MNLILCLRIGLTNILCENESRPLKLRMLRPTRFPGDKEAAKVQAVRWGEYTPVKYPMGYQSVETDLGKVKLLRRSAASQKTTMFMIVNVVTRCTPNVDLFESSQHGEIKEVTSCPRFAAREAVGKDDYIDEKQGGYPHMPKILIASPSLQVAENGGVNFPAGSAGKRPQKKDTKRDDPTMLMKTQTSITNYRSERPTIRRADQMAGKQGKGGPAVLGRRFAPCRSSHRRPLGCESNSAVYSDFGPTIFVRPL